MSIDQAPCLFDASPPATNPLGGHLALLRQLSSAQLSSAQALPAELCSIFVAELTLLLMHFLLSIE
jgi:hypothetical protein